MRWSLPDIAEATGGSLHAGPPGGADHTGATGGPAGGGADPGRAGSGLSVDGVCHDSRDLRPGEMFVAIRAERDGHEFVPAAAAGGAAAVMVEDAPEVDVPAVVVGDTGAALLHLGRAARRRLDIPVIGITGSVGKTSTKDMAAAALGAGLRTVASARSFNNELGVPLTLANAPESAQVAVLEMGARGPGHIALLCDVARPVTGIVTAVAPAHTEMFGDLEGIARAKGELVESLPASGLAVLNGDDDRVRRMATRGPARAMLYSTASPTAPGADLVAENITLDSELRPRFTLRSPWGTADVLLEARGAHQVGNAMAALAVAVDAGVDLEGAAGALRSAALSPMRMDLRRTRSGGVLLDDSYNANPSSMAAALRALGSLPAERRIAVLGLMAELGPSQRDEHLAIADLAASLGIEVVAVGTADYGVEPAVDAERAADLIGPVGSGVAVLVKGSRVAGLEKVATRLTER